MTSFFTELLGAFRGPIVRVLFALHVRIPDMEHISLSFFDLTYPLGHRFPATHFVISTDLAKDLSIIKSTLLIIISLSVENGRVL